MKLLIVLALSFAFTAGAVVIGSPDAPSSDPFCGS